MSKKLNLSFNILEWNASPSIVNVYKDGYGFVYGDSDGFGTSDGWGFGNGAGNGFSTPAGWGFGNGFANGAGDGNSLNYGHPGDGYGTASGHGFGAGSGDGPV